MHLFSDTGDALDTFPLYACRYRLSLVRGTVSVARTADHACLLVSKRSRWHQEGSGHSPPPTKYVPMSMSFAAPGDCSTALMSRVLRHKCSSSVGLSIAGTTGEASPDSSTHETLFTATLFDRMLVCLRDYDDIHVSRSAR